MYKINTVETRDQLNFSNLREEQIRQEETEACSLPTFLPHNNKT